MDKTSLNNKDVTTTSAAADAQTSSNVDIIKLKNPLKKAHWFADTTFVIIDDRLVKRLKIDKENTWLEQEQTDENTIILRVHHFPDPSILRNTSNPACS